MKHLFDLSDFNVYDENVTNLSVGAPGPDLLESCCKIFQEATAHRMKYELENNSFLFQYGPTLGTSDYRTALAKFLTENYQDNVNASDLVLTSGASSGLHLILSCLLDMDGFVFVDSVTYMIALECFGQFPGLKVKVIPFDESGPDLECLEKLVREFQFIPKNGKIFWGIYYTIPIFHNPTGVCFSAKKCEKLVEISRKYNLLICCDDVYNLLYYNSETSPKRLFAYDKNEGNVISNGSFSKILSPGIRIGWMECPKRIVDVFDNCGVLKSGGACNNYVSGLISSMISLGLADQQLRTYRETYKERMKAATSVLGTNLNKSVKFQVPEGGYFVWLEFPEFFNALEFNKFLVEKYRVSVIPGPRFSAENQFRNFVRICVVFHSVDKIEKALLNFCTAVDEFLPENQS